MHLCMCVYIHMYISIHISLTGERERGNVEMDM